ncbi:zinc finger, CCHC-type containing protein [Tanacetum coccineum]|uniref:Zinc finger, CCHC-type containing protein n=1 Tax=Tanacetum coccineum TaxID=301880 RepID=A0ABQ5FGF0_9ASTR
MGDKGDKNEKENPISLHYPMLTRSNYVAWAIKMRVHLSKDSRGSVVVTSREATTKDAWETLKTMFIGAERVKTAKVEEAYVVKKLLCAVPSKFLQIASTIEQFADLDNMTVEKVIGKWLERSKKKGDEEQRTLQRNTRSSGSNNRGRGRGRGRGNYSNRGGRHGGGSFQNRDGGRGSTSNYDKSKVQCYNCQDLGHYAYECKNPRKERNQEANLTQKDDEPALLLYVRHEVNEEVFLNEKHLTPKLKNLNEESNTSKVWYLDNGASNHMTGDRDKFSDIDRSVQGTWRYDTDKWGTFMGSRQEWKIAHEVDDFSRVMWVYMLKSKDEALGMFQKFCVLVENETSVKVKTLRSDRGGEFNSKAFTEYCNDTGLKHHFTAPYSPQQNGVVERRNRSVIEMTRSMMKSMEVPDTLWGEAVCQAVYI